MLVMTINEMKTPNTMDRYRLRIFGLFYVNSMFLVFAIPDDDANDEDEPREDTLADIPPLLTPAPASSLLVLLVCVPSPSKLLLDCSFC